MGLPQIVFGGIIVAFVLYVVYIFWNNQKEVLEIRRKKKNYNDSLLEKSDEELDVEIKKAEKRNKIQKIHKLRGGQTK